MRRVLFLCTGNYYRSRFAAALFDHLAADRGFEAVSRGFAPSAGNAGAVSPLTVAALVDRGIELGEVPEPALVVERDLEQADVIVVVDEVEHRSYVERDFPDWTDHVRFWRVADLDRTPSPEALGCLEVEVRALVAELAAASERPDQETSV